MRATSGSVAVVLAALAWLLPGCGTEPCPSATCAQIPGPLGDTHLTGVPPGAGDYQHPDTDPSPRYLAAIAYDASHAQYVLFGGQTKMTTSGETWIFYGYRHVPPAGCQYNACDPWGRVNPAHKPPARSGAAMAYDPTHHVVVMFGGQLAGKSGPASDTWTWDGSDWTQIADAAGPGPREGASMVTAGDRVLLFGGKSSSRSYADVWTWDGHSWSRLDADPTPPGRGYAAVTWDPKTNSLVILGGTGSNGRPLSDSWQWNASWAQLASNVISPVTRANSEWDHDAEAVIVTNGISCPGLNRYVWSWDGARWKLLGGGVASRWGAALAEDTAGNTLLFGGSNQTGC